MCANNPDVRPSQRLRAAHKQQELNDLQPIPDFLTSRKFIFAKLVYTNQRPNFARLHNCLQC